MKGLVILDEYREIDAAAWAQLKTRVDATDGVNIIEHKTTNEKEDAMFMSRHILPVAMAMGLVHAHRTVNINGVNHQVPVGVGDAFHDVPGKRRPTTSRPSGAAAAKRAKAKRRNIRARASKRA